MGTPLVLLGGLITIPFWGYRHISMAMLDIMLADTPRVVYLDKKKITKKDIEEAEKKTRELQENIGGKRLGIKLKNKIDTNQFIKQKINGV